MWSGAIVCVQPRRLRVPWTVITFEPIPSIAAPIATSIRARSWTWGSEAALRITVGPAGQRGGHQRVLGRHHRRLVHQEVARAAGRAAAPRARCRALVLDAARRARGTRRGADRAGGGRSRRRRAAASGACRSGPAAGPASRNDARIRSASSRSTSYRSTSRRRPTPRPGPSHSTRAPSVSSSSSHRLDVADPRHVAQDHLVLGEQARGQDRQRAVLVSGRDDRA